MNIYLLSIAVLLALSNAEPARNLGRGGGYLQNKIESMCPTLSSECPTFAEDDCIFEKPAKRPDFSELTEEEIEDLKAKREERKEMMLLCICCDELDLKDLPRGGGGKPGGSKGGYGGKGANGGKGPNGGRGGSLEERQAKLDAKCPQFECEGVDSLNVDCARFDAKMNDEDGVRLLRGKGGDNFLYCGCCRNGED